MSEANESGLNLTIEDEIDVSMVMQVAIDDTLTVSGEAADAKAVGDALAQKADRSETRVSVNGQQADNQGLILLDGEHIPVSEEDQRSLTDALSEAVVNMTAEDIPYQAGEEISIKDVVDALSEETVRSVNGNTPDESGDVTVTRVDMADNLYCEDGQQIAGTFMQRTTGGNASVSDGSAWALRITGNQVHAGFVAEELEMTVMPIGRTAPPAITATIDEAAFIAAASAAGTYRFEHDGTAWSTDPAGYGITVTGDPVDGDLITVEWDGENHPLMAVIAVERAVPEAITATIDRDAFVTYVQESGTITLYYTTEWSADPAEYGITVTGDPVAGDQIRIVYVKEERGTITVATPTRLAATGWNLFDSANGRARVVRYSDSYGYKIGGAWTALAFSETLTGERSAITPDASGLFNVPGDGYVWVTGGDDSTTYILATWSDWTGGPAGAWEAYRESGVTLSVIMAEHFPHGLMRLGNVYDEIDLDGGTAISRIVRMDYSAENLAAAKATGRAYDYDENYIYVARASAAVASATVETNEYTVSEHGIEFFEGTAAPAGATVLYGQNLKDKLKRLDATMIGRTATNSQTVESELEALDEAAADLAQAVQERKVLIINIPTFSTLPQTVSDSRITSSMVLVSSHLSNPFAQSNVWTVRTDDGTVRVGGVMATGASTSMKLFLMESR